MAMIANRMASHVAEMGLVGPVPPCTFLARSSRYSISFDSKSSRSMMKPQKGCVTSLYVLKSLPSNVST